jgi:anti-sigma B factor antagonist
LEFALSRPGSFEVKSTHDGTVLTLSVIGELDMATAKILSAHLINARELSPAAVTIDLRRLTFMDSSGLRLLIDLNDRAKREGWYLTLIAPTEEAAVTVLQVTGADKALPFEPTNQP